MFDWKVDLGLDLGTSTTTIYRRGRGVLLCQPSLIAFSPRTGRVVAVGEAAKLMASQASQEARGVQPLAAGVVADHEAAAQMVRAFVIALLGGRPLLQPRCLASLTTGATPVEQAALVGTLREAGLRHVRLLDSCLAAALGLGFSSLERTCRLLVNIGAGVTTLGIISGRRLLWGRCLRFGGQDLDEAIRKLIKLKYGLSLTAVTAEQIKIRVGSVLPHLAKDRVTLSGDQVYGGLFRHLSVSLDGIPDLLAQCLSPLAAEIKWILSELPAEQRIDIEAAGLTLLGGTSLLAGLPQLLTTKLALPVTLAREPTRAVVTGLGAALEDLSQLSPDGRCYGRD